MKDYYNNIHLSSVVSAGYILETGSTQGSVLCVTMFAVAISKKVDVFGLFSRHLFILLPWQFTACAGSLLQLLSLLLLQ
jgi:hypothetical protein